MAGARAERARREAAAWVAHPAMAALRARLAALDAAGGTDGPALIAAARPLVEEAGWVEDAVRAAVRACAGDPWFEPPFRTLDGANQLGLVLFDDRRLRLSVQRVPLERVAVHKVAARPARSVAFTGALALQRVLRAGGAELDWWEAPPAGPDFTAARAGRCRRVGRQKLRDGDTFAVDGRRQAWTLARQGGDMLLVQATARVADAPLAIEYDAATGAFRSASATDGAVARMQLMASVLRLMGRKDAAPAIAAAAAMPGEPFFLRWHLLRELAALDRAAALPLLRAAAGDGHPELAATARAALSALAA